MKLKFAPGTDYGAFLRSHVPEIKAGSPEAARAALALVMIESLDGDVPLDYLKRVLDGRGTFLVEEDGVSLRYVGGA
jgi:hypothetical protein